MVFRRVVDHRRVLDWNSTVQLFDRYLEVVPRIFDCRPPFMATLKYRLKPFRIALLKHLLALDPHLLSQLRVDRSFEVLGEV